MLERHAISKLRANPIIVRVSVTLAICLAACSLQAALIPIAKTDFSVGATTLDFSAVADGTEANGLVVDSVLFQVSAGNSLSNGVVIVDGGPGMTNNISPENLVSVGTPVGTAMIVSLPGSATQFGYGFAILATEPVASATTLQLFAGQTPVGTMSFDGIPDPTFTGGFAGASSIVPFDRAVLTFSGLGDAFAVDNVTFANIAALAEKGSTLLMFLGGLLSLLACSGIAHRERAR